MNVTPEAEVDLEAIQDWYESQRQGVGARFNDRVAELLAAIDRMPEAHRIIDRDLEVRRVMVPGFPYAVYYRLVDGEPVVFGVFHGRRDPRLWRSRL